MSRYIDREDLLKNLKQFAPEHLTPLIVMLIEKQPTADVQEVRRGRWLYEDSDIGWTDYKCYDCGNIISTVNQDEDLYSYCPYCGARMDGKEDEG